MARTRGASAFHQDDGVLLDREGKPIPTEALRTPAPAMEALMREPEPAAPPEPPRPARFICNQHTWGRGMDGYQALLLLQIFMGDTFAVELSAEEFSQLNPNARQHFRRV
jgi:hypothetical protein